MQASGDGMSLGMGTVCWVVDLILPNLCSGIFIVISSPFIHPFLLFFLPKPGNEDKEGAQTICWPSTAKEGEGFWCHIRGEEEAWDMGGQVPVGSWQQEGNSIMKNWPAPRPYCWPRLSAHQPFGWNRFGQNMWELADRHKGKQSALGFIQKTKKKGFLGLGHKGKGKSKKRIRVIQSEKKNSMITNKLKIIVGG